MTKKIIEVKKLNEQEIYKANITRDAIPFSKLKDIFNMVEIITNVELKVIDNITYAIIYFENSSEKIRIKIDMTL